MVTIDQIHAWPGEHLLGYGDEERSYGVLGRAALADSCREINWASKAVEWETPSLHAAFEKMHVC